VSAAVVAACAGSFILGAVTGIITAARVRRIRQLRLHRKIGMDAFEAAQGWGKDRDGDDEGGQP
jgi:hypothetical protein